MSKKVVLAAVAGVSGGHIIPALISLQALAQDYEQSELLFFSTGSKLDKSLLSSSSVPLIYCTLPLIPVPGRKLWRYPLFFIKLFHSFVVSYRILSRHRPEKVLSMGGLVSVPVCSAAWLLGSEIILFELNAVPGKAVRWLAPLAKTIHVCFKEAEDYFDQSKVVDVPYPLRFHSENRLSKEDACRVLGIDPAKKVLLILGGSQGSRALNTLVSGLGESRKHDLSEFVIIHQTGDYAAPYDSQEPISEWFKKFYKEKGCEARVFSFTHDLAHCYAASDLILARAGAGTLFEIEFFNRRAVVIPLENVAESHQLENALAMIKRRPDLFSMVRQEHAFQSSAQFYEMVITLIKNPSESKD